MRNRPGHAKHFSHFFLIVISTGAFLHHGAQAAAVSQPGKTTSHLSSVVIRTPAISKTVTGKPTPAKPVANTAKRPLVSVAPKTVASAANHAKTIPATPTISGTANHLLISMRAGRKLTTAQLGQLSALAGQKLQVESNQGQGQYMLRLPRMTPYASVQAMATRLKRNSNLLDAVPTQIASTRYMVVKAGHPITINAATITPNATGATTFRWQQIRGRKVLLANGSRPAVSFTAPHRVIRKNAAAVCDPNVDPTCTGSAADPSLSCDPSIDPTCGTITGPAAACDPTIDPTCTGSASSSDPTLVCDPTSDPTCAASFPSVATNPAATCDPTVDPTCNSSATPATIPGGSPSISSCGSLLSNALRRNSSALGQTPKSVFGLTPLTRNSVGQPLLHSSSARRARSTSGGGDGDGDGDDTGASNSGSSDNSSASASDPGSSDSGSSDSGSSDAGSSDAGSSDSGSSNSGSSDSGSSNSGSSDPGSSDPGSSNSGSSNPVTAPANSGASSSDIGMSMFTQLLQDLSQLLVDLEQFMCTMQANMGSTGHSGQSVNSRRMVSDKPNVLGFRLMTTDKAGHNVMHRVYVYVAPNLVKAKSVKSRQPVPAVKKPILAAQKPAVTNARPARVTQSPLAHQ